MSELARLLEGFPELSIGVVGEAMVDSYLRGSADRLSREAPVPILSVSDGTDVPGGAANAAVNLRALGARVRLLSVIGEDPEGQTLRETLADRGIDTAQLVVARDRRTLAKRRLLAGEQMLLRFDQGTTDPVHGGTEERLRDRLHELESCDAVIVSDYGYGVLTPRVRDALRARTGPVVVDAKDVSPYRAMRPTAVKPNYEEAVRLLGERELDGPEARADQICERGDRLLDETGADLVAVTLDSAGAVLLERGRPPYRTYANHTHRARSAGAGDTFVAALTLALASGADVPAAGELASAAAGVVVGKEGTSACSALELREVLTAPDKRVEGRRLLNRLEFHRRQGHRIAFTNGCFDILHRGHITYLNRAKTLGDVLIVGLNSDDGVRRLKGAGRPINALQDRVEVLAALSCVDYVVPFEEDTPVEVIRMVRPDAFVKGGDYTKEMLPEAPVVEELGGLVRILPYFEDRSTTGIIDRIRDAGNERDSPEGGKRTAGRASSR